MRLRTSILSCCLLISALSPAQEVPRSGKWVTGPKGSAHDITNDAVTKGELTINEKVVSDDVTVFLGCKSGASGVPALELRFLMSPFRGYSSSSVGKSATLTIDGEPSQIAIDNFPVQTSIMFIALPTIAGANKMASIAHNRTAFLNLTFPIASSKANFSVDLTEPLPPIATVLKACRISLPDTPAPPAVATSTEKTKYTFEGIHLGMTAQQVLAAEKAIATSPIKPGVGGGADFETAKYYFIGVSTEDHGKVDFYKVCGKTSKAVKSGPKSGPLYDEAIKSFGPANGKLRSDQHWVQWDKSGGVDARYEWDSDEEPGGCLYVTKASE